MFGPPADSFSKTSRYPKLLQRDWYKPIWCIEDMIDKILHLMIDNSDIAPCDAVFSRNSKNLFFCEWLPKNFLMVVRIFPTEGTEIKRNFPWQDTEDTEDAEENPSFEPLDDLLPNGLARKA